jgi:phosphoketolase
MALMPVFEAAAYLEVQEIGVRIVSIVNPRRLYRPTDVAWDSCSLSDGGFLDDAKFEALFGGDALIGVTAGASGMLEPVMLRSNSRRDTFAWKRGETTASPAQLMAINGLTAENLVQRALELVG